MTNLLHLVISLVEDPAARTAFRNAPEATVADIDDLTGEDVAAVVDVARTQLDPAHADALTAAMTVQNDAGSPHEAAIRALTGICEAADA